MNWVKPLWIIQEIKLPVKIFNSFYIEYTLGWLTLQSNYPGSIRNLLTRIFLEKNICLIITYWHPYFQHCQQITVWFFCLQRKLLIQLTLDWKLFNVDFDHSVLLLWLNVVSRSRIWTYELLGELIVNLIISIRGNVSRNIKSSLYISSSCFSSAGAGELVMYCSMSLMKLYE